jgi:hypothetical protein
MTQTAQLASWALINNKGKDFTVEREPPSEDNNSLLLALLDSLNNLSEKINKLDYFIQRKDIEQILNQTEGEIK